MSQTLQNNLQTMQGLLQTELKRVNRSRMLTLVIGVVLIVGVGLYLNWVHSGLREVQEPYFLSRMVQVQVERKVLPEIGPQVRQFMLEELPATFDALTVASIQGLPQIRGQFVAALSEPLDEALTELDRELDLRMRQSLDAAEPRIKAAIADLPQEEKRRALAREIAFLFRQEYTYEARSVVNEFQSGLHSFARDLNFLMSTDNALLTPGQLQRKELILLAAANLEALVTGEGGRVADELIDLISDQLGKGFGE